MSKYLKSLLPLLLFLILAIFLLKGLYHSKKPGSSPLIGKPVPTLSNVDPSLFKGHVTLLNVFASWCTYCRAEHPILMDISKTSKNLHIVGIDYKDQPDKLIAYLKEYGNPYSTLIADPTGQIATELGVYGTPATFIIDKEGIIRYKQSGAITLQKWNKKLKPMVQKLLEAP